MVTNGLSPVTGDDADTTRKALAKEVGSRDLTDPSEWSAKSSGHGGQWDVSLLTRHRGGCCSSFDSSHYEHIAD